MKNISKIAYIVPSLVNEGPVVVVHSLVVNLIDKVDTIHVYYFDDKKGMDFPCPTFRISMNKPIDFDTYDVVHSNCLRPDKYLAKWIQRSKVNHALTVSTLHQDTFKTFSYEYNKFFTTVFSRYWLSLQLKMDVVVAISNQLKEQYAHYFQHIITIYNGCNIETVNPSEVDEQLKRDIFTLKNKYKVLGSYALITRRKGLIQILRFLKQHPDYAFVLIGEGPGLNELKMFVEKWGMQDRVIFHSYVKAPYHYLEHVDVYVMTSYSEGFGLSMVEAAMQQKAIVCSDIPSFNEIFTRSEAAFFQLDDEKNLEDAITYAYENRLKLGKKAYEKAIGNFTSEIMAENHLKLYGAKRPKK